MASGGSLTEPVAREQIVRYAQRLWDRRHVTGTSGNISVRLESGDVLVTPSQRSLAELLPDDLVLVDASGRPRDAGQRPTSELPLHLAAYRVRKNIICVIHTHPTMTVVVSKTGALFSRDTVGAAETLRESAWTPYRKNGTHELAELCAEQFARGVDVVVMERHGLSVAATSLEDAFMQTDLAEEASRIAYFSSLQGTAPPLEKWPPA